MQQIPCDTTTWLCLDSIAREREPQTLVREEKRIEAI